MSEKQKLRVAIVGMGSRGTHCFAELLSKRQDACEIVAMCDCNPVRLNLAAEKYGVVNRYVDFAAMLATEQLDGLVITVPDYLHAALAVQALEAGVNVLTDKPLATTVKGCRQIIAAAEKSGKVIMIGFNLRHHAVLRRLKQIISDGVLGRVFMVENREFYHGGRTYMARWNRKQEFCRSLWIHKGSHDFDVFNWLLDFPKPRKVSAFARIDVLNRENLPFALKEGVEPGPTCTACPYAKICPDVAPHTAPEWAAEAQKADGYAKDLCMYLSDKDVHDNGIAMVEYDNGIKASHLECFITSVNDRRYTIVGTRGQAMASLHDRQITIRPRWSEEVITYNIPEEAGGHGGADPSLVDNFLKVIAGEVSNTSTAEQGMWSTAIGEAAEISRTEERTVFIDELFA